MSNEPTCARCGMPKSQWTGNNGEGIREAGGVYCCPGCANATGCICKSQ